MATTAKALQMSAELADRLKARLAGSLALVQSVDTDQNPLISIGPGTNGGANMIIKVMPSDWGLAQDILGNTAIQYAPHKIQVVTEANNAAGAGADVLSRAQLFKLLPQVLYMGTHVDWFESTNGTAPTIAAAIAGNLKASVDPDVWYPMISSQ